MDIEILKALTPETFADFRNKLKNPNQEDYQDNKKNIEPELHDIITDPLGKRGNKTIYVQGEDGSVTPETVIPTKISIALQKHIINIAKAFLTGKPVRLNANTETETDKDLFEVIKKTWDDNKLDFETATIAELKMAEKECAELWFVIPVDKDYWNGTPNEGKLFKLRLKVLANSLGDSLFPIYDQYGDMIAFGREYEIAEGDKKTVYFELFKDDFTDTYVKKQSAWGLISHKPNFVEKIQIIYHPQKKTETEDVETLISRFETSISNYADVIDRVGSPIVKIRLANGKVVSFPKAGEAGKVVKLDGTKDEADIEYMTWDHKPEAVIYEQETLWRLIHTISQTPDTSWESMTGLGHFSIIALKMYFMSSHLKAMNHWQTFGSGIQRRVNFIKAAMIKINNGLESSKNLSIKLDWEPYMPSNDLEMVQLLSEATGGKASMSTETSVGNNPFVYDVEMELERMKDEVTDPLVDE